MSLLDIDEDPMPSASPSAASPQPGPSVLDDIFAGVAVQKPKAAPPVASPPPAAASPASAAPAAAAPGSLDDFFAPSAAPAWQQQGSGGAATGSVDLLGAKRDTEKHHGPVSFELAMEHNLLLRGTQEKPKTLAELASTTLYVPPPNVLALMNHYEVLGLAPSASSEVISKTYKQLAMKFHPDKRGSALSPQEDAFFKSVTKAHEILMDTVQRTAYDASLKAHGSQPSIFDHMA